MGWKMLIEDREEILIKADNELNLLQKGFEEQKRKKQFLMQLLLTGIVRVKA